LQAAAEVLEGKMGSLREEVAEQAATAALLHKFNSGASEPTGEVTRQRLVQGLLSTKEVCSQRIAGLTNIGDHRFTLLSLIALEIQQHL
jgi:hypothetical protein